MLERISYYYDSDSPDLNVERLMKKALIINTELIMIAKKLTGTCTCVFLSLSTVIHEHNWEGGMM